jgi:molybdopterin-binding protein
MPSNIRIIKHYSIVEPIDWKDFAESVPLSSQRSILFEMLDLKISARNVLKAKVKAVAHGSVNSEITVELPGGTEIVSIITKTSAEQLNLTKGKDVYAIVKATSVMIATD